MKGVLRKWQRIEGSIELQIKREADVSSLKGD